ncbi:MAG: phage tail sheath family protein [Betaproteobacteria bacterium]|nr:phage tail sheath family protein [Betaproteobacteria bacterium]
MAQVSYPGVYIVEKPSGVRTITGVATSIAAFVGYTRKGEPDRAVSITSFADFERTYGGLDRDSPVSYAVRQFFSNGGTQAFIVRVAVGHATASWVLQDATPADVLEVEAASPGAWGNDLRLTVEVLGPGPTFPSRVKNPDADFNLIVSQVQNGALVPVETHRNLSMNANSAQYAESVVNNASTMIRVHRSAGLVFNQAGFAVSGAPTFPLDPTNATIGGTVDGTMPFVLTLANAPWNNIGELVTEATNAIANAGLAANLQATETGPDGQVGNGHLQLASATPGESSSVVIAGGSFGGLAASIHMGLANGGREFTGAAQFRPAVVADVVPATPGVDGTRGGAIDLVGSESAKTGMYALLDVDLFNIFCIPETFDMTAGQEAGVIPQAIALCELKRAFYIVDAPSNRTLVDIGAWASGNLSLGNAARNSATYFPAVRIVDPLDGLRPRGMAPSGTLAGIYARTDAQRGVWKAPAGTDATLNGVLDLASPMNDLENGQINPLGVNALRTFPAYGRVAWGARTARGADAQADEYKYIPIRRLALFLEESLYRGTQWVVFEPNDEPLWAQIRLNVGAFMNGLFRQGAFQGTTPQDAFFVKCDKETTTQADRNLGIVNIVVGFAPLKPAEFVVITIQQIAGDLQ